MKHETTGSFDHVGGLPARDGDCVPAVESAREQTTEPAPMKLKVGDVAPDFKLQYFDGSDLKDVSLSQYRGKSNVVVAFYIFAFTGG